MNGASFDNATLCCQSKQMLRVRFGTSIALVATSAFVAAVVVSPASGAPATPVISSLKAKAAAIEQQLTYENNQESDRGSTTRRRQGRVRHATVALKALMVTLAKDRSRVQAATAHVRRAAVEAYVLGDSTTAQYGAMLTKNVASIGTIATYAGAATGRPSLPPSPPCRKRLRRWRRTRRTRRRRSPPPNKTPTAPKSAQGQLASTVSVEGDPATGVRKPRCSHRQPGSPRGGRCGTARAAAAAASRPPRPNAAAQAAAAVGGPGRRDDGREQSELRRCGRRRSSGRERGGGSQPAAASASVTTASISSYTGPIGNGLTNPAGNAALTAAEAFLGVPYVWGGANTSGVDCSGLTMLAWATAGIAIDHSAYYQYKESTPVAMSALEPGDLLFYYFPDDGSDPVTHVAMYVGNNTVIQAPETGEVVSYHALYTGGLVGAGRP